MMEEYEMKHKILIASLAAVLLLSACGTDTQTASQPEGTEQTISSETAAAESVTEASETETSAAETTTSAESVTETSAPETTKATTAEKVTEAAKPTETIGQKNAVKKALSYLDFMAFSRKGLIEQLEYEGFSHDEAVYGVDKCGADWNAQAAQKAADYLDFTSFSRDGLIEQLEYEGFTHSEAVYGVDAVEKASSAGSSGGSASMGQSNAVKKAQSYLDFTAFSRKGLIEQLEYEGFTNEEAVYGADHCGADWKEQAAKKAAEYLDFMSFSKQDLIEQLEYEGFTASEAAYGVSAVGY